jgi:hypothetical protein
LPQPEQRAEAACVLVVGETSAFSQEHLGQGGQSTVNGWKLILLANGSNIYSPVKVFNRTRKPVGLGPDCQDRIHLARKSEQDLSFRDYSPSTAEGFCPEELWGILRMAPVFFFNGSSYIVAISHFILQFFLLFFAFLYGFF